MLPVILMPRRLLVAYPMQTVINRILLYLKNIVLDGKFPSIHLCNRHYSTQAKKNLKKYRKDLQLMKALFDVLEKLTNDITLPKEYKAHSLIGIYKDCMECHIKNDFLLI